MLRRRHKTPWAYAFSKGRPGRTHKAKKVLGVCLQQKRPGRTHTVKNALGVRLQQRTSWTYAFSKSRPVRTPSAKTVLGVRIRQRTPWAYAYSKQCPGRTHTASNSLGVCIQQTIFWACAYNKRCHWHTPIANNLWHNDDIHSSQFSEFSRSRSQGHCWPWCRIRHHNSEEPVFTPKIMSPSVQNVMTTKIISERTKRNLPCHYVWEYRKFRKHRCKLRILTCNDEFCLKHKEVADRFATPLSAPRQETSTSQISVSMIS